MDRRAFTLTLGMGLVGSVGRAGASQIEALAAALLGEAPFPRPPMPVHWQATHNNTWRWVLREEFVDGKWRLTGMTTPVRRDTGEPLEDAEGYLDESEVPEAYRVAYEGLVDANGDPVTVGSDDGISTLEDAPGPDAAQHRRDRHGRPPSRWLRTLSAAELSVWLATVDPPEATVEGFTFEEHLTRDHHFNKDVLSGLSELNLAKLHAAAHHGY